MWGESESEVRTRPWLPLLWVSGSESRIPRDQFACKVVFFLTTKKTFYCFSSSFQLNFQHWQTNLAKWYWNVILLAFQQIVTPVSLSLQRGWTFLIHRWLFFAAAEQICLPNGKGSSIRRKRLFFLELWTFCRPRRNLSLSLCVTNFNEVANSGKVNPKGWQTVIKTLCCKPGTGNDDAIAFSGISDLCSPSSFILK